MRSKLNTKAALFFRSLNPEVKRMFKVATVRRGETMQDVIEAFMRLYLKTPDIVNDQLRLMKRARSLTRSQL